MIDRFHREFAYLVLWAFSILLSRLVLRYDVGDQCLKWEDAKMKFKGEQNVRIDGVP